ncbi:MAG: S1C family serine protease [Culicoidibacterales bacterium]
MKNDYLTTIDYKKLQELNLIENNTPKNEVDIKEVLCQIEQKDEQNSMEIPQIAIKTDGLKGLSNTEKFKLAQQKAQMIEAPKSIAVVKTVSIKGNQDEVNSPQIINAVTSNSNSNRNNNRKAPKSKSSFLSKTFFTAMAGAMMGGTIIFGGAQLLPTEKAVMKNTETSDVRPQQTASYQDVSKVVESVTPGVVTVLVGDRRMNLAGSGSGVVYHKENGKVYILTNAHVVAGASGINVYRNDLGEKKVDEAKVVAVDKVNDIAVLEIKAAKNDYPKVIDFANSDKLLLGQKVVAVGSPLGSTFSGSVTEGIISGLNRQIAVDPLSSSKQTFIQTDAAINGGNSGGALIDMNGRLIGINSAKISSADNIGLAIPSNIVESVLKEMGAPLPVVQ